MLQIEGGPGWIASDRYDIEATAEGNPSQALMRGPMLQALLENRFKLRFHNEIRLGSVYVLTVAKRGVRMPSMAEGSCTHVDLKHPPSPSALGLASANFCGTETRKKNGQILTASVHGISLAALADGLLAELSGRTVIDKTGLDGLFDFHLEFSLDQTAPNNSDAPAPADAVGPSIFTALQEQVGLKLESTKGPVKVFVVDHIEQPSAN
ncbi:MAG TPA: TIGR03435 family protein [Bryobacteraceae bacterium]|nr:TIGR03435 family protein [Bryobacteraceae bacterium]